MKKIFFAGAVLALTMSTRVMAQDKHRETIEIYSWSWGATGNQTVDVPGGRGKIQFYKNGDKFSNVVFLDSLGKSHRLSPVKPSTGGAPSPTCKYPLPDACFSTADKNIGLCICKPTDLSAGGGDGSYMIGLLLPAVQKVRMAAQR